MTNSLGNVTPRRGTILEVPFTDKEEAKKLGAWWDPDLKKWFVPIGKDTAPFRKWLSVDEKRGKAANG